MTTILIFGDSITWGAWDSAGGWAQRLRTFIEEKHPANDYEEPFFVYPLGIPGDKTTNILERFEFEAKERFEDYEKDPLFIFGVGGNDSAFIKSKKDNKIPKEQFKSNITEIIKRAKKFTKNIIFIGTIQHDEAKSCPIPWNKDMFYYNRYQKEYNELLKQTCKENKVHFIDLIKNIGEKDLLKNLDEDGLHPNSEGHKRMFEIIKDYIIKNKLV